MVYRKGELQRWRIDNEWPALPAAQVVAEYNAIDGFCRSLSVRARGHSFQRNGSDFVVKCFQTKEDADKVIAQFGGEYMTPETRPTRIAQGFWSVMKVCQWLDLNTVVADAQNGPECGGG